MSDSRPRRGEIWLAEIDKVRPAVVMHRDFAGRNLSSVLVAPLTSTIRDIPAAVRLGPADGLDRIASIDNLSLVLRTDFVRRIGALDASRMQELCRALAIAVSCN